VFGLALTIKQEKFCIEYAKSGNARQAYINAGYKSKSDAATDANASRLISNDKVAARLAELTEEAKDAAIADIREMQETLTRIIRQQTEEVVIICDPVDGVQKVKKPPAIKEVIGAINTLGKMQGAFVDRVNLDGAIPVVISGADELED
jgi:phage terminase small subunit